MDHDPVVAGFVRVRYGFAGNVKVTHSLVVGIEHVGQRGGTEFERDHVLQRDRVDDGHSFSISSRMRSASFTRSMMVNACWGSISIPIALRPRITAATRVDPDPTNGSKTVSP